MSTSPSKIHIHTVSTSHDDQPSTGCANPHRCEPHAHAGLCRVDTCACGATRRMNYTPAQGGGVYIECGQWELPAVAELAPGPITQRGIAMAALAVDLGRGVRK